MASDVLRTGALGDAFDLNPQDRLSDDLDEPKLAVQQATDLLQLHRGEFPTDTTFGIDWLGRRQRKVTSATVASLGDEIRRLLLLVPSITQLSTLVGTREGRLLSFSATGVFGPQRADVNLLVGLVGDNRPGANDTARLYLRSR